MKTVRCRSLVIDLFVLVLQVSPVLADGKARSARPVEVGVSGTLDLESDQQLVVTTRPIRCGH